MRAQEIQKASAICGFSLSRTSALSAAARLAHDSHSASFSVCLLIGSCYRTWYLAKREVFMSFALLRDPATDEQLLLRNDHVSAVEVKKGDESVTVHLVGGQTLHLTHEQSKQFVHHVKTHMHPIPKT